MRFLIRWLFAPFIAARTERERSRWMDGSPRTQLQDDGMARLRLIKGLKPGAQPRPQIRGMK